MPAALNISIYGDSIMKATIPDQNLPFIDVRQAFPSNHNFKNLISADGIHPSGTGYALIFDTLLQALPV